MEGGDEKKEGGGEEEGERRSIGIPTARGLEAGPDLYAKKDLTECEGSSQRVGESP